MSILANRLINYDFTEYSSVAICPVCDARFLGEGGSAKTALDLLYTHMHHADCLNEGNGKALRTTYKKEGYILPDIASLASEDRGKRTHKPRRVRVALMHPTEGRGQVNQPFGANPRAYKQLGLAGHNGQDYGVVAGTPVVAVYDGEVAFSGQGENHLLMGASAGLCALVEHKAGSKVRFYSGYAHLSRLYVAAGDTVKAGQVIGLSGASGLTTGDHLHFELLPVDSYTGRMALDNGYLGRVDPAPYLEQGGCLWEQPGVPATEQGGA